MTNFDALGGLPFGKPLGYDPFADPFGDDSKATTAKATTDKALPLQETKDGTLVKYTHTKAEADYARIHAYKATTIIKGLGKVTNEDGGFVQNGKKVNLSTLMMNLMLQRVQSVDGVLSGMINQMNQNNVDTKNLNDFLEQLREMRPTSSDGTVSKDTMSKAEKKTYDDSGSQHVGPAITWNLDLDKDSYTQGQIDQLIEVVKSKISTVNSNQQMEQIKLEKYNNVRNESMQLVSTVMKADTQSVQSIVHNMGG